MLWRGLLAFCLVVGASARLSQTAGLAQSLKDLERHIEDLEESGSETTDVVSRSSSGQIKVDFLTHESIHLAVGANPFDIDEEDLTCDLPSEKPGLKRVPAFRVPSRMGMAPLKEGSDEFRDEDMAEGLDIERPSVTVNVLDTPAMVHSGCCPSVSLYSKYIGLVFASEPEGPIYPTAKSLANYPPSHMFTGGTCYSPFHKLSEDDFDMFKWVMWTGTQYGWHGNHYSPIDPTKPDGKRTKVEGMPTVRHVEAQREAGQVADSQYALVTPGEFVEPFQWLCEKLHTEEFCQDAKTRFLTFRGMRLSFDMTTPPLCDLVSMRGMLDIADCEMEVTVYRAAEHHTVRVTIPQVTEGSCLLTKGLAEKGLLQDVLDMVEEARHSKYNLHLVLSGLSFGGAIAQVALATINTVLREVYIEDPSFSSFVRVDLLLFSSPRVGTTQFADYVYGFTSKINQFVVETYPKHKPKPKQQQHPVHLAYDPVAMWPENLHPLGNIHSVRYYFPSPHDRKSTWLESNRIVREVLHNLRFDPLAPRFQVKVLVPQANARKANLRVPVGAVAKLDRESFGCLHVFNLMLAWAENRPSTGWCKPFGVPHNSLPYDPPVGCERADGGYVSSDTLVVYEKLDDPKDD